LSIERLLEGVHRLEASKAPLGPQQEKKGQLCLRRTGSVFEPWQRLLAHRLSERGLLRDCLADRPNRDRNVRLMLGEAP
jgi:hypothetical protein